MNRGTSNGRVNFMKVRLEKEWREKVTRAASLKPAENFKMLRLDDAGKFNRIPKEQIVERAGEIGNIATISRDGKLLYIAVPKKAA